MMIFCDANQIYRQKKLFIHNRVIFGSIVQAEITSFNNTDDENSKKKVFFFRNTAVPQRVKKFDLYSCIFVNWMRTKSLLL